MYLKNNTITQTNQHRNKNNRRSWRPYSKFRSNDTVPHLDFTESPELILREKGPGFCAFLNILIWGNDTFVDYGPQQNYLAKKIGVSVRTIARYLDVALELGLVDTLYRHGTSNLYKVSSYFRDPNNRQRLRHLLPSLKYLPLLSFFIWKSSLPYFETNTYKLGFGRQLFTRPLGLLTTNPGLRVTISSKSRENPAQKRDMNGLVGQKIPAETKRSSMKAPLALEIPNAAYELGKQIRLTQFGQIQFSAFPIEALLYASDNYRYAKNVRDPEKWARHLANEYCRENNLKLDWSFVQALMQHHGINKGSMICANDEEYISLYGKSGSAYASPKVASSPARSIQKPTSPTPSPRSPWQGHTEPRKEPHIMVLPNGQRVKTVNRLTKWKEETTLIEDPVTVHRWESDRKILGEMVKKLPEEETLQDYQYYVKYLNQRRKEIARDDF